MKPNVSELTEDYEAQEASDLGQQSSYQDCLATVMCPPALPDWECQKCDSLENFKDELLALISESMIDEIQYKQWVSTDRSTLESLSKPTD